MIHRDQVLGINVALVVVLLAIALAPRDARAQVSPNGGEFQVNTFTLDFQYQPAVAADAQGNFVVVWQSNGSDGS